MKRKEGESFEAYKERRKLQDGSVKKHLQGRRVKYTRKEARAKASDLVKNFKGDIVL